ncbi:MAG: hypothetical protein GY759_10460 [Chloroflexi bacterium]|nr:hypothetical protein [Chloroflexota bacterium]
MTIDLHFDEADWQRVQQAWTSWWAGELTRPLVMIEGMDPDSEHVKHAAPDFTSNFGLDVPADHVLDCYQARLQATHWYGDAFPKWWLNFGPGIMAGFLGAEVHCVPDTVWFTPAKEAAIAEIDIVYDAGNPWWLRVQELTQLAVQRWGDRVAIAHTDLGGNLDILASLRDTQQLLFDLCDDGDEVVRLVGEITTLWVRYYDELAGIITQGRGGTTPWAGIWSPKTCYMLQCDFSYMISPQMFERFVLPDLAACCDHLDHAFYHLDGKGQIPHLDMLLSLERLRGIQWIPGDGAPPPEQWMGLLKRIRDAGKLCQLYTSPEGAKRIVQELGGQGFAFYIQKEMQPDQAANYLRSIS